MSLLAFVAAAVLQQEDYGQTWDKVAQAIRTRYYAREARQADMDTILSKYAPDAKAARSHDQFRQVVARAIHDFHDSHFAFLTDADQGFYLMDSLAHASSPQAMPEFGAWFGHSDLGGYTVQMVLDGSEAERAGLRKGDRVTEVNGTPFTPIDSLRMLVDSTVILTVDRNGVILHPQVKITAQPTLGMFLDATRASSRTIVKNGRKIGYFHLWTMASDDFRKALQMAVIGKSADTDAFILDIRDGFGGRPEGYGDPFFRPDVLLNWKTSPTTGYTELFGYGRPLVLITNGGSRSAKEIFSYVMKKTHRATLLGQTTAGNVLGTFPQRLNSWSYLEIPLVDVSADGVRLENNGVRPDMPLAQEIDPAGHDLDLAAAIEKLSTAPLWRPQK